LFSQPQALLLLSLLLLLLLGQLAITACHQQAQYSRHNTNIQNQQVHPRGTGPAQLGSAHALLHDGQRNNYVRWLLCDRITLQPATAA
jgi:hypothetical protein